jgi:AcrR family transcriptional regulator
MGRRRGRPPGSDGASTRERLLAAAAARCIADGFERVTLADIAAEAGVTPAAAYNHFSGNAELVFEAADRAVQRLVDQVAGDAGPVTIRELTVRYLDPELADARRLFLELHVAATHHPELGGLVAGWYGEAARQLVQLAPDDPDRDASVVALFVLTLGICHVDQLNPADLPVERIAERIGSMVDHLFPAPPVEPIAEPT